MTIRQANSTVGGRFSRIAFNILIAPLKFLTLGVFGLLVNTTSNSRTFQKLKMKVPLCSRCKQDRKLPRTDWADFEEGTISIIVPRNVADAIKGHEAP